MLRVITISMVFCWVYAQMTDDQLLSVIFGIGPPPEDNDHELTPKCNGIDGRAIGCYECYPCKDEIINNRLSHSVIQRFKLKDASCNSSIQVCCVSQTELRDRSSDKCGVRYSEGKPRSRRTKIRSVLQGEYPYRAWVFQKSNLDQPLCAATFINEYTKALIVPASCINRFPAQNLRVSFIKFARHQEVVDQVIVHENFDATNNYYDIAILTLRSMETAPDWLTEACVPFSPPPHGIPCISVSTDDLFVNAVIPLTNRCSKDGTELHPSQICAIAPPRDYIPEKGAGLYCLEPHISMTNYIVHGMALHRQDDIVTTYTNVSYFTKWIHDKLHIA